MQSAAAGSPNLFYFSNTSVMKLSKSAARESATVPTLISREATRLLQEYFMAASAGPGDISRTKILRVC